MYLATRQGYAASTMTSVSTIAALPDLLVSVAACHLYEIPRSPLPDTGTEAIRDQSQRQRLAAVISAYHAGPGPIMMAWHRSSDSGPIQVYVGGSGLTSTSGVQVLVSLPAGGRGRLMEPGALGEILATMPHWTPIAAASDGLVADTALVAEPDSARPSLEDCLLGVWQQPFAWLMLAEPITGQDLDELIAQTSNDHRQTVPKAASSPDYAISAQRLQLRHRELSQAVTTGLWRTRLLAGGTSVEAAIRVAALLCASADLDQLPYQLIPGRISHTLQVALTTQIPIRAGTTPFQASSHLVAAIARPPAFEIPGVQCRLRPQFDVTPETQTPNNAASGEALWLGKILDRNSAITSDIHLPRSSLNRHTFVCGATGAGKSQTVRALLEAASTSGLPWLVIEPAKAEYRAMATRLAGRGRQVVAIKPGEPDALPAGINPLEPAIDAHGRRYPLQTHLDLVRALFLAAFESDEPFPQVLSAALTRCYEHLGWDLALGEPAAAGVTPRYPSLGDLQDAAEHIVQEIGYGQEITDNVRGFIKVRLSSLRLGTTGRFFEGGHRIDFDALMGSNVVFEIEDVGDDRDKAFLMGTVLIRLVEHLRLQQRHQQTHTTTLQHLSVFEEAHRLLRNTDEHGPAKHAVEMFAGLLAEIRAYGEGLIIAEQIPSKLVPDVIKNTAVKIVHRLPAQDDRDAVGATMNITDAQSQYLVTLPPGQAAVFTDGMDYPLLVAMPDGTARETGTTPPADAAALITPRSTSCGIDCHTMPCTLRHIRTAQRALQTHPFIVMWAELAVLAHLTGWATPIPRPDLTGQLRALDRRTRDCALSHAVDTAVTARSTATATHLSPDAFTAHVTDALRTHLDSGAVHTAEEPQWLAPAYQWSLIHDALLTVHKTQPDASRHPRSSEWEHTYQRPIPGDTNQQQLRTVQQWLQNDHHDTTAIHTIAYGTQPHPAIITAIGTQPDRPHWTPQLQQHLAAFHHCHWPQQYLTPTTWNHHSRPTTGA